jgi:hypothetical protein
MDKDNDYDIRNEVTERMYGIGHHSSTMAHDSGDKLEEQQHNIHQSAYQRYFIDLTVPFHQKLKFCQQIYHFIPTFDHKIQKKCYICTAIKTNQHKSIKQYYYETTFF